MSITASAPLSTRFDAAPVPVVTSKLPRPSAAAVPVDEIVAKHTATRLQHDLRSSFFVQSLMTGLPLVLVDLVVISCLFILSSWVINFIQGLPLNPSTWLQLAALLVPQVVLGSLHQLYPGAGLSPVDELRGIVRSTFLAVICLSAMNVAFGQFHRIEFAVFACAAVSIAVLLPVVRFAARMCLSRMSWWGTRALLVGSRQDCDYVRSRSQVWRKSGIILADSICVPESANQNRDRARQIDATADVLRLACRRRAPMVAFASPHLQSVASRLSLQFPSLVWVDHAPADVNGDASDLVSLFSSRVSRPLLRFTPRLVKRCLDLAICIPGLIVLALPMAAIAVAIKICSPGPVFYGPIRIGRHGEKFRSWKFRSMVPNAEEVLQQKLASDPEARREWERDVKLKSDPRIIPGIGNLLRSWSLDELPQLWNVLLGEMSLVGPRPIATYEIVRYQEQYYEYTQMSPGITGLWQVSGRNNTTFSTRVLMVQQYATNWSLWLDAWILAKTPIVVITKHGAY